MDKFAECCECRKLHRIGQLVEIEIENPTQYKNATTGKFIRMDEQKKICSSCKAKIDNRI